MRRSSSPSCPSVSPSTLGAAMASLHTIASDHKTHTPQWPPFNRTTDTHAHTFGGPCRMKIVTEHWGGKQAGGQASGKEEELGRLVGNQGLNQKKTSGFLCFPGFDVNVKFVNIRSAHQLLVGALEFSARRALLVLKGMFKR